MRRSVRAGLSVLAVALTSATAYLSIGQTPRPAAPTPARPGAIAPPVATPAPADAPKRQEVVVPPGYQKVTVGDHSALCEPGDVEWVRRALADVKPAVKPNPAVAEVLKNVADQRAALSRQVATDLALPDDRSVSEFLDGKLIPTLKKLDEVRIPLFFLVTTQNKLRDLTKTGWGEPRFHYNRVADAAAYESAIPPLTIDRPMDDVVLPALYAPETPVDARTKSLTAGVQELDATVAAMVTRQVNPTVFSLVVQFLRERHLDPLKLRRDQQWLAMGVSNYLATRYAGMITGVPRENMLRELTTEPQGFPVNARSIDLLRPVDESSMKPELVPYYTTSMQRKSLAVVAVWVDQAGETAIPKTLTALRKQVPPDGPGLVKLVQEASGADLSRYLSGQ